MRDGLVELIQQRRPEGRGGVPYDHKQLEHRPVGDDEPQKLAGPDGLFQPPKQDRVRLAHLPHGEIERADRAPGGDGLVDQPMRDGLVELIQQRRPEGRGGVPYDHKQLEHRPVGDDEPQKLAGPDGLFQPPKQDRVRLAHLPHGEIERADRAPGGDGLVDQPMRDGLVELIQQRRPEGRGGVPHDHKQFVHRPVGDDEPQKLAGPDGLFQPPKQDRVRLVHLPHGEIERADRAPGGDGLVDQPMRDGLVELIQQRRPEGRGGVPHDHKQFVHRPVGDDEAEEALRSILFF